MVTEKRRSVLSTASPSFRNLASKFNRDRHSTFSSHDNHVGALVEAEGTSRQPTDANQSSDSVRDKVFEWIRWSALTTIPLLTLTASGTLGTGGVGPYLNEVERWTSSGVHWVFYLPIIAAYSVAVEYILRVQIQTRVRHTFGSVPATTAASLSYAMIHLRYGPYQFVYALALGYITAIWFQRVSAWRPLAVWHLLWNAAAISVAVTL